MHVFTLLGDPVRLRIVEVLAGGEQPVARITEFVRSDFAVSRSAVSHQLRVLRDEGFVAWENRVRWPYAVSLDPPPERLHRAGRAGLRGRSEADIENRRVEDDWWPFAD